MSSLEPPIGPASATTPSLWERLAQNRRSIRSILAVVGGNSAAVLLTAAGGVLAARFVDPETIGTYRTYTIPLMYLTLLHLGTFDGLHRQIPLYLGQDRIGRVDAVASAAGAWNLIISVGVSLVFLLLSGWRLARGDVQGALGWASQAIMAWGVFYAGYLGATYRTINHFVALARVQTLQSVLSFLLVYTLPIFGFFGLCLRAAAPSLAGTWLFHRNRPLKIALSLRKEPLLDLIKIGLPFCVWGSLYTSLWGAIESTLMLALGGVKGLGLFAIAIMLREGICILPQGINQVLMPRIVQAYGRDGRLREASASAYRIIPTLAAAMVVLVVVLSFGLDVAVPRFVPNYSDGLTLMKVSLWMGVVQTFTLPLNGLVASGRSWRYGRGILAGAITFPIVTYLLAPLTGGMVAVAAGSLAGKAMRTALGYWELALLTRSETR